jgi:DNA mismatch repair protein MutS
VELVRGKGQVQVAHMRIVEKHGQITFLHELASGPAEKSYGIHVAQLAGLPSGVVKRARELLDQHERGSTAAPAVLAQTDMFAALGARDPAEDSVLDAIRDARINELTPLQALSKMAEWQQELI